MIRFLLIALALLSIGTLKAQTFSQVMYPSVPFDTVNFEHDYTSQELVATSDGGLLLLGNDDHTGYVSKIDAAGAQVWAQQISMPLDMGGDTVTVFLMRGLELSNGDILLSMRTGGGILAPPVLTLAQLSPGGNLIWAHRFPGFSLLAESLVEVDNRILMIGNENFGGQNVATVLELDNQGEIISGRRCIFPFWFTSLSMDGAVYQDNKFLFWDSFFEGAGGPNQSNFSTIITEYDFNTGNFSHVYQTESLTSSIFAQRIIYDIVLDNDGSRYISYQKDGNFLLTRFNTGGDEAWTLDIGSPGHLLVNENSVFHLGSSTSPTVAAFKRFDKQDGTFLGAQAHPGFSTSFTIGDPILVNNEAVYWPTIAQDPDFDPLPITPISIVRTDTLGLIASCEPQEICEANIFPTEPSGFAAFDDLPEEASPQPQSAPTAINFNPIDFVITPFCVPTNEEELDADFDLPSPACTGDSIRVFPTQIDPALSTSEWTANMASPDFLSQDTAIFQFFSTGNFDIEHILIVEGCKDTVVKSIEILEGPVFELGSDTAICTNESLLLESGLSADNDLVWQDGSTNPDFLADLPGLYTLEATNDLGCVYTDQILVSETPLPLFSLGADSIICKGNVISVEPDVVPSLATFLWSTGEETAGIQVSETADYGLRITNEENGCEASDTLSVSVRPFPTFTYRPADTVFCPGVSLILEAESVGAAMLEFTWSDGSVGDEFLVPTAGNYVLLASDGPCQDTLSFDIPAGECLAPIYAPSAFSPNNDGRNDLFQLFGPDIEVTQLRIYDRWGSMLFESEETGASWNGEAGGQAVNPGLYIYQAEYLNKLSLEKERKSGDIILVR